MLADFTELAQSTLKSAVLDQKAANEARILDRAAFQAAVDSAQAQVSATDSALKQQLTEAVETLKQEQHDDERAAEILGRSLPAILAKLTELASL